MALDVEKIEEILFWVTVLILILLFAWYVFGNSPTIEQISFVLTLFFVFFAWKEMIGRKSMTIKLDGISKNLNKLDDIYNILNKIEKNLNKK